MIIITTFFRRNYLAKNALTEVRQNKIIKLIKSSIMEYHVPPFFSFTGAERILNNKAFIKVNRPTLASFPMEFLQFNKAVYYTMLY